MKCKDCLYFDTEDGKEGYCQEFVYPVNDRCFCNIDSAEAEPEKQKPDIVEVVMSNISDWYARRIKEIGYKGCRNCTHQIETLRTCEWNEKGGDRQLHLICPRWERREDVRKPD